MRFYTTPFSRNTLRVSFSALLPLRVTILLCKGILFGLVTPTKGPISLFYGMYFWSGPIKGTFLYPDTPIAGIIFWRRTPVKGMFFQWTPMKGIFFIYLGLPLRVCFSRELSLRVRFYEMSVPVCKYPRVHIHFDSPFLFHMVLHCSDIVYAVNQFLRIIFKYCW